VDTDFVTQTECARMQVNVHEKLDAVIDQIAALKAHLDEVSDLHWEAHTREHIAAERTQGHTNELLNDVRMRFIPREVFEGFSRVTAESVNRMNDRLSQLEGRFLGIGLAATSLGAVALVVSLIGA